MKHSTWIRSIGRRGFLLLIALPFFTDEDVNAQAGSLAAPVLNATAKEGNVIELSWTSVSGAVRYELWTWPGNTWEQLDDGALTDTTYCHIGLSAGTTYYALQVDE